MGWEGVAEFYEDLQSKGHPLEHMHRLVRRLAESDRWAGVHPSTSHAALGLSRVETHQDRLEAPMVYITPTRPLPVCEVHYQEGQGRTVKAERVADPFDVGLWQRIQDWLDEEIE